MRRRAALPIAAGFVSIAAFCVLAAAGLPILGRYLLLPAAILAVFCGAGALGWLRLPARPRRGAAAGRVIGGVVLAAFVAFAPAQADRIADLRSSMGTQEEILADLHDLTDDFTLRAGRGARTTARSRTSRCGLASRRARSSPPSSSSPTSGLYVDPASERVLRNFTLDPRDPRAPDRRRARPASKRSPRTTSVARSTPTAEESGPCTRRRSRPPGTVHLTDSGRATPHRPSVTA